MTESSDTRSLQDKLDRLQELTEFTESCKKQIDQLLQTLGWTEDYHGPPQEEMEQCPYDPNHTVPVRSLEKHKACCLLNRMGYSHEEQAEMYDPSVCYEKSNVGSFVMDKNTQHQVILQARSSAPLMRMEGVFWQGEYSSQAPEVPQNHKRATCDLTVADRLALYNHVSREVSEQRGQVSSVGNEDLYVDLVAKLKKGDEQSTPKSHLELMAEMRDYKRRRQSYRAKNVHITKKSYTEVIREVIDVHSAELARQWGEDEQQEEEAARALTHSSHRGRSRDRRSASTESRHSHFSAREGHGSHGKRHRSRERSQEKTSKKKRKRDSRSPDNGHHDRKKKKKKKEREKEKEKEKEK